MRKEHPTDWEQIRCVIWLPAGQAGMVTEEGAGNRRVEAPPPSDHDRLSTILEEPSEVTTEDSLFIDEDPDMTAAALDASASCLRCLPDEGTEPTTNERPSDDAPKEPPQYDWNIETYVTESLTPEQLSHALTLTNEEFVEL